MIALALPLLSEGELRLIEGLRKSITNQDEGVELIVLSGGYEASLRKLMETDSLAGAIGEFISPAWLESLSNSGIALVQLGSGFDDRVPSVSVDLVDMGSRAVDTLLKNGALSLAYLGASGPSGSMRLGASFAAAAGQRGMSVVQSNELAGPTLKEFLRTLPRPAGLLCASDLLARRAVLAAHEAQLKVPDDLAVIGVGNARLDSLYAGINLSSFALPHHEIGFHAGNLLLSLLSGTSSHSAAIPFTVTLKTTLHERESSIRSTSGIVRALAYLRSNPATQMNAGELARFAGMSRRAFEMAVKKEYGTSPGMLLNEIRRTQAETLLKKTDQEIAAVGRECGFVEPALFSTAFRRWTGQSPRDYRMLHRVS